MLNEGRGLQLLAWIRQAFALMPKRRQQPPEPKPVKTALPKDRRFEQAA